MLVLELITIIIVLQRLSELALASRNRKLAFAHGGREYGAKHYRVIVLLHLLWLFGFNIESLVCGGQVSNLWPVWTVMFCIAQVLRYWAIASLGNAWNTRIIIVPGRPRITRGPYRWLAHPNYVAVILEFIAVPLLVNAPITAVLGTALNITLLWLVRIPAEDRALEEIKEGHRLL